MSLLQSTRAATKEDYPFDPRLQASFRLAEKGLDGAERAEMKRARVRLLLYPQLADEVRERLEAERVELEAKALATLSSEERERLEQASEAVGEDEDASQTTNALERSLKRHVESAELRLNPALRDRLLQARRSAGGSQERTALEAERDEIQGKVWGELPEQERLAMDFFSDVLPDTPAEREQLERERVELEKRALETLPPAELARVEAGQLAERAEASLASEERERVRAVPERRQQIADVEALRAKAEEVLDPEERMVLLRSRLLERRDQAEASLSQMERRKLSQVRQALRGLSEREQLEAKAESRLGAQRRARLDELRERLNLRRDLRDLRQRADRSLALEDQQRLRHLRAQLKLTPAQRSQLEDRLQLLAFGNLSGAADSFAEGLSERDALVQANQYLAEILGVAPFNSMMDRYALDEDEAGAERLCELLVREARPRTFRREGARREAIVRQGDYGSTAFLILEGSVRILLQSDEQARAAAKALGSTETRRKGFFSLLKRWLGASPGREVRAQRDDERYEVQQSEPVPIVIKDFDRLPAVSKEHTLGEGEVFGEIAALTRTPRTASVVPDSEAVRLLEIRWQGLRALVNEDEAFQRYVEERYRDSSRRSYVFRTGLFAGVGDTDAIRARLRQGDVRGLFFDELGWHRPREREGLPSEFRIPSAQPSPLAYRLRLWLEGEEGYRDLDPQQEVCRLGAAKSADVRLPLRPQVSPEHAELSHEDGRWFLRNRSRHGTVVDGERVRDRIVLFPGAKIRIGEGCWLMFQAADLDAQATGGDGELALRLLAESPVHNGIGGIKAYLCELGQRALPDPATCEAALGHVLRREYLAREPSRHVLVFQNAAGETDWRWRVPISDARAGEARERGGLRLSKDVTPLVTGLIQPLALEEVIKATDFVSYGKFRWFERGPDEELEGTHWSQRTENQPVIANQGHYPNGVIMIRAGFARLTRESDQGERTVSYLRPEAPYGYGLEEVIENYLQKQQEDPGAGSAPMTLPYTLRAIGYADTVFFPTPVLERFVLPTYRSEDLRELIAGRGERVASNGLNGLETVPEEVPSDLREFLVQHHLINGTQAMVINLDRCTRCDDCVRGCSSTHQRDPRFVRHGLVHGNLMVANACMHCVDPVCLIDCPTGAIHRPLGGGLVLINDDTCIGCTACAHNCPYDNIRMVPIRNDKEELVTARVINEAGQEEVGPPLLRATKCDLCHDQATGETSCVRACPHDALKRVDLSQMGSLVDLVKWLE